MDGGFVSRRSLFNAENTKFVLCQGEENDLRKIAIFTILFMLVSASALAAEPIITSKNAAENIISISLSLIHISPGSTEGRK